MLRKNIKIYSQNAGSQGAKRLARALGVKRLKHHDSQVNVAGMAIINWGSTQLHTEHGATYFNSPEVVASVVNKLEFFQLVSETDDTIHGTNEPNPRIPEWTTSSERVRHDLEAHPDRKWLARTILNGHSGAGIRVVTNPLDIPPAPCYTRYIGKKNEYRVHFVGSPEPIFTQRKALRSDYHPQPNWLIRSHDNGFKFVHGPSLGTVPGDVVVEARRAFVLSGLDFGAVDVIWTGKKAYVLEINTAPGMEGTTVEKYAEAFRTLLEIA